ncbi:MAG TPA: membrane protein insertion efficiency factor YidD [Spirochaetota bacterium]|nr:membrane protein insertion efficiency factor YidD [Spirochaetota bacterium]
MYGGPQAAGYLLIRFFQVVISPQDGPNCRFHPVCSVYAAAAVERFGLLAGSVLAGDRVLRCNPYTPPGEDPLPLEILGR